MLCYCIATALGGQTDRQSLAMQLRQKEQKTLKSAFNVIRPFCANVATEDCVVCSFPVSRDYM